MAEPVAATTPRYLKTPDAAIHLGLSARTLEKHRCYGTGPVFRRLGGQSRSVRSDARSAYRIAMVDKSDAGSMTRPAALRSEYRSTSWVLCGRSRMVNRTSSSITSTMRS